MQAANGTFSVVLCAYNEERFIATAIESVLAQTRTDFELVVVDDGSQDRTAEVVRGFDDPRISLLQQPNRGLAPSLNTGIAAGNNPIVALIDADDLWLPTFLEMTGEALESNPDAGFAYTDAWRLQEATGRFFRRSNSECLGAPACAPSDPNELALNLLSGSNWLFGLTAMKRPALEAVGGFDEQLSSCEDYELWLRFLANGYRAVRAPGRLAIRRDRGESMSKDAVQMYANLHKVFRIAAEELPFPEELREVARRQAVRMKKKVRAAARSRSGFPRRQALRARVGRVYKALLPNLTWHEDVPEDVLAVFPQTPWLADGTRVRR